MLRRNNLKEAQEAISKKDFFYVEVFGPPASGKTTILQAVEEKRGDSSALVLDPRKYKKGGPWEKPQPKSEDADFYIKLNPEFCASIFLNLTKLDGSEDSVSIGQRLIRAKNRHDIIASLGYSMRNIDEKDILIMDEAFLMKSLTWLSGVIDKDPEDSQGEIIQFLHKKQMATAFIYIDTDVKTRAERHHARKKYSYKSSGKTFDQLLANMTESSAGYKQIKKHVKASGLPFLNIDGNKDPEKMLKK